MTLTEPQTQCSECGEALEATLLVYVDIAAIQPDKTIRTNDITPGFRDDWASSLKELAECDLVANQNTGAIEKAYSISCKNGHDHSHLVWAITN
jgi:hypothetical protein